jgi:two-component system, OmpR family, heavy metal sensor histidine kinase CusS
VTDDEKDELVRKNRALSALIVHDLRSPLAALAGFLELAQDDVKQGAEPGVIVAKLADCRALVTKTLGLVATLLDVDELEDGMLRAHRTLVPVVELVSDVYRGQQGYFGVRRLRFEETIEPNLSLMVDRDLLGRVVDNLLDNAMRYVPRQGRVELTSRVDGDSVEIAVGNSGPPVSATERDAIFGRYFQVEARRAAARANRGLGLYFCKLAVEAHGGTIAVETRGELGAVFVVRLPTATALHQRQ